MYYFFYFIEYQDWDENANPIHKLKQEYVDNETNKQILYRSKEKAKQVAEELSSLTRTFEVSGMRYSVKEERLKQFIIVE